MPKGSSIGRRRVAAQNEGGAYYNERLDALKAAAATLFKEKGLRDTNLDDIARLANVDRSSLYYYIGSRKELFFRVVHDAMKTVVTKAEQIQAKRASAESKIEALLVMLMDHYAENYPTMYVFLQEHLSEADTAKTPELKELMSLAARVDEIVMEVVQSGVKEGVIRKDVPPRIVAYSLLGLVNWTHRWFKPDGKLSGKELGQVFARMLLDGVRAKAPERGAR